MTELAYISIGLLIAGIALMGGFCVMICRFCSKWISKAHLHGWALGFYSLPPDSRCCTEQDQQKYAELWTVAEIHDEEGGEEEQPV